MGALMTWLDDIAPTTGHQFEHATEFTRERAKRKPDPSNPKRTVEDWADPDTAKVYGYLASGATSSPIDPARSQTMGSVQLVSDDPHADIRTGDRIRQGQHLWKVAGFPAADTNPFTGLQPTLVANLEEVKG